MVTPLRKLEDLVHDARAAATTREADDAMRAAAARAARREDWEQILGALAEPTLVGTEVRAWLVVRARAFAHQAEDAWTFRRIAELKAGAGDVEAARATLGAAEEVLAAKAGAGRALGYEWATLAAPLAGAAGDREGARRVLETGFDAAWAAGDVENLGRVVSAWAQTLDRSEARARMHRIEDAARGWGNLDGTIYWWHALGDAEAGRRVRAEIVATARTLDAILPALRYWDLYEKESPGFPEALARAESLAPASQQATSDAEHATATWKALADIVHARGDGEAAARCLLRAVETAAQATARTRAEVITSLLVLGLGEAADRIGPRGLRPDALEEERATALDGFSPSASALFDVLRRRITASQIAEIAKADYGQDAELHREALAAIVESGLVPPAMPWHPGEVVELSRWSEGEGVDHLARALCATLCVLASANDDLWNTGPILVESCLALGEDLATPGEQLLAWRATTLDPDEPTALAATLLLFVLGAARHPDDARLDALLARLEDNPQAPAIPSLMAESLRADLWAALVDRVSTALRAQASARAHRFAHLCDPGSWGECRRF